jgi:hypothetical protein
LAVTFEEGTWSAWLYDLLNPHVDKLVVCRLYTNYDPGGIPQGSVKLGCEGNGDVTSTHFVTVLQPIEPGWRCTFSG